MAKVAATQPTKSVTQTANEIPAAQTPSNVVEGEQEKINSLSEYLNSDEARKHQEFKAVRRLTVGAQIKRVLDLLLETRQALTAEEISDKCFVDMKGNKDIMERLKKNAKVKYDGDRFAYKSRHTVKDKNELLMLIRKFPDGILVSELNDSYPAVLTDLEELRAGDLVWCFANLESEDVVYPNDPNYFIKVDDDLKELYREVELPKDMLDIEKYLNRNGMEAKTKILERRAAESEQIVAAQKKIEGLKKKKDSFKRRKVTNPHMIQEIFPEMLR